MPTLQETLLAPDIRPHVIADCEKLVDREVAEMSGVTGTAVRLAYKTVRTFDAGHIPAMIETILPSVAEALQPYWANFTAEFSAAATSAAISRAATTRWPRRCSRSPTAASGRQAAPRS